MLEQRVQLRRAGVPATTSPTSAPQILDGFKCFLPLESTNHNAECIGETTHVVVKWNVLSTSVRVRWNRGKLGIAQVRSHVVSLVCVSWKQVFIQFLLKPSRSSGNQNPCLKRSSPVHT